MPTSLLEQWPRILWLCGDARPPGRVLDVGPGHGKAATLLREYVAGVVEVWALEAHAAYVDEFRLRALYDVVGVGRFEDANPVWLTTCDTVLLVDVVEHMNKGEALAALDRCRGQIVICTPVLFEQTWRPGMPETERHVSQWCRDDFDATAHPVEWCKQQFGGWLVRLGPLGV